MNNEKEIERMEYEIFSHTDFHGREYEAKHISQALINAGIGDKKQAVKDFADKLKANMYDISIDTEYVLRIDAVDVIDNLITELYGDD